MPPFPPIGLPGSGFEPGSLRSSGEDDAATPRGRCIKVHRPEEAAFVVPHSEFDLANATIYSMDLILWMRVGFDGFMGGAASEKQADMCEKKQAHLESSMPV